jgi:hypothetical protein
MGDRAAAERFLTAAVKAHNDTSTPKNLETAYSLWLSACHADPTFFTAWYEHGCNNSNIGKSAAAVACWRIALTCECTKDERAKVLSNMAWRLFDLGKTREALATAQEALDLDSSLVNAWVHLAMINQHLCNHEGMLKAARRAVALEPDNLNARIALSFAHLFDGQYAEGFRLFECRFPWRLQYYLQWPYPKWNGEDDKVVFLSADQGMGDTLSFARFVERAAKKARYLHICIQPALMRLFTHCFSHLTNVNLMPQAPHSSFSFPIADCWTTFVSLPYVLGLTDYEVRSQPHIQLPDIRMPVQWKFPDREFHVGISWAGSPLNDINQYRNIPVEMFYELARVPGVALYSLQMDEQRKMLHETGGASLVRDLAPYVSDVCDTLGMLGELDLVVTCESFLGHAAALAGKECWIPYSWQGRDYRIGLAGEKMLWTPKHRVFRQQEGESWAPAFRQLVEALKGRVHIARDAVGDRRRQARSDSQAAE